MLSLVERVEFETRETGLEAHKPLSAIQDVVELGKAQLKHHPESLRPRHAKACLSASQLRFLKSQHALADDVIELQTKINGHHSEFQMGLKLIEELIAKAKKDNNDKLLKALNALKLALKNLPLTIENIEASLELISLIKQFHLFYSHASKKDRFDEERIQSDRFLEYFERQMKSNNRWLGVIAAASEVAVVLSEKASYFQLSDYAYNLSAKYPRFHFSSSILKLDELITTTRNQELAQALNNLKTILIKLPSNRKNNLSSVALIDFILRLQRFKTVAELVPGSKEDHQSQLIELSQEFAVILNSLQGHASSNTKVIAQLLIVASLISGLTALCTLCPPIAAVFFTASLLLHVIGIASFSCAVTLSLAVLPPLIYLSVDRGEAKAAKNVANSIVLDEKETEFLSLSSKKV